jgi:hypothetical protein
MMGAGGVVNLLRKLINEQTLPGVMNCIPPSDWKQWAKERPSWVQKDIEAAPWRFLDQNGRIH